MEIDSYGALITDEPFPGSIGDSCANTARFALSEICSGKTETGVGLGIFRTSIGYLRHPSVPNRWSESDPIGSGREPDFTSDQALPLLMAFWAAKLESLYVEMKQRVKWRTSVNHVSSIGLMLISRELIFLFAVATFVQVLIFWFPYRWSDDQRVTSWWKLVRSEGSTADYLNFSSSCQYLKLRGYDLISYMLVWLVGAESLKIKILKYYGTDTRYVVASHFAAINKITG